MTDEEDDLVQINFSVFRKYYMKYYGGWGFIILANLTYALVIFGQLTENYLIGKWS